VTTFESGALVVLAQSLGISGRLEWFTLHCIARQESADFYSYGSGVTRVRKSVFIYYLNLVFDKVPHP